MLNETQIIVTLPHTPCIAVSTIPFNVTVFATNGRGNGERVGELVYVEEDGTCKYTLGIVYMLHFFPLSTVSQPPRGVVVERVNATHMR